MPWSEIAPGKLQRAVGENENFLKLVGDPGHSLGREHWTINATASLTAKGTLAQHNFPSLLLKAWKNLRFRHPSIAAHAIDDQTLQYIIPDTTTLSQWAAETFNVALEKTADDLIPHLKPNAYATLTYLPKSNEILCHTAHWRTDGLGVLLLIDAFLDLIVMAALPDPDCLTWGEEVSRLAPAVEEAAGMPTVPTDAIKTLAQECIETFYHAAGAIGIPYKGENTTIPSGTRSTRMAFSLSETLAIVNQCKAKEISVTAAVHASVALANRALASEDCNGKHYTSTIRFSLRPYLPEPYSTPAFASGLYTTG